MRFVNFNYVESLLSWMFPNFPGKITLFGVYDLLSKYDVNIINVYYTLKKIACN